LNITLNNREVAYHKPIPLAIKKSYQIESINIEDREIILLSTPSLSSKSIKKNLKLFSTAFDLPIVLYIEKLTSSERRYLIENNISFVSSDVIYLPRLLIYLDERIKNRVLLLESKKFSKLAQQLVIYLLINGMEKMEIKTVARLFLVSTMSASRVLKELEALEFMEVEKNGRNKIYHLVKEIDIETLLARMSSPVVQTLYIKKEDISCFDTKIYTSYSALSHYANITSHKTSYVIEKNRFESIRDTINISTYDSCLDPNFVEIELWRYAPLGERVVEPISLYLSLREKEPDDIRTQNAMGELYNKIKGVLA
ncbi:hypothetical protein GSY74_09660, partial [Sulfurovum sp. bin170]|uniref:hypothetical protein n=1 Tax=Sulfurovum sp. bin170 TaxID=2695268 RepID=UPI0013DFB0FD